MSAPNLTRIQAAERAGVVTVSRYAIDLDLTDGANAAVAEMVDLIGMAAATVHVDKLVNDRDEVART